MSPNTTPSAPTASGSRFVGWPCGVALPAPVASRFASPVASMMTRRYLIAASHERWRASMLQRAVANCGESGVGGGAGHAGDLDRFLISARQVLSPTAPGRRYLQLEGRRS